jgi:hypothetical protein
MMFAKQLRDRVMLGEITCSVRIWQRPKVKVGGRYRLGPGFIEVSSVREIGAEGITSQLARKSGFKNVADLLSIAKHGPGDIVYLVEFDYQE